MNDFYSWVLTAFNALLALLVHMIWQDIKSLQKADVEYAKKLSDVEILVYGHYVTREDFGRALDRLFTKLDTIESKLNTKVDK